MAGIIGISALLSVLGLSLVITRLATVALMFTGLSEEAARFQARSAFTGTGFTTSEAENVVDHPVRRRIIMSLMLLRSAGIITIVLSLILSFVGVEDMGKLSRLAWLVGGVLLLWVISRSRSIDRALKRVMTRAVQKWPNVEIMDYTGLLRLSGDYVIREMQVEDDDWMTDKELSNCRLRQEGVIIIGIYRTNGDYVGVPTGETRIYSGDRLVLYGRQQSLQELDLRREGAAGDREHDDAVGDEQRRMQQQEKEERAYEAERD